MLLARRDGAARSCGTVCSAPRHATSRSPAVPGAQRCSSLRGWRWPLADRDRALSHLQHAAPGARARADVVRRRPDAARRAVEAVDLVQLARAHDGEFHRAIENSVDDRARRGDRRRRRSSRSRRSSRTARGFPFRRALPFVMLYPRATPGLIIGIGFFWTYLLTGALGSWLRGSIWGIMLAFVRAEPAVRLRRHVPDARADRRGARPRGPLGRSGLVATMPQHRASAAAARDLRVVHPDVRRDPQRLRPRALPRQAGHRGDRHDHALAVHPGVGRAGRGARDGAGRRHGRRARRSARGCSRSA